MARIWTFFTEKTALSYLILSALFVFGMISVLSINRESAPEVQIPIALISSALPGASPEDIESLIIEELEIAIANIDAVKKYTSTSREGFGTVVVEFEASADIKESIDKVKDEVDKVKGNLPSDATDPFVTDVNFADQPVVIASIVSNLPATEFIKASKRLADEIESISGVSRAEVTGVREREVNVVVRKEDLALYGLTLQGIVSAISASNITAPVGTIETGGIEYPIAFKGALSDTATVSDIPITTPQGAVVRVSDVAFVVDGVAEARTISRVSEEGGLPNQAATLLVFKRRGADITRLSKDVGVIVESRNLQENSEAKIVITYDAGKQIIEDLTRLTTTGLQTIALVLLALFVTLGLRAALIASLSIPLSFLTAFIVMNATGNTINFISLFSLILAIGILVDTAIVMTEAIHTNMKKGMEKRTAVKMAIRDFHYPVTTGNLTTIAVFFPLFTISGITGEFIASIPFTVIAVLVSSLIISLAFIPLIASTFLKNKSTKMEDRQERYAQMLREWYKKRIPWLLDSRKRKVWFLGSLTALFFVLVTLPFFGIIRVSFFPQSDVDFLYLNLNEPQGTPLAYTDLAVRPVEDVLLAVPEIESFTTTVGAGSAFDQNAGSGPNVASITINLLKARNRTSTEILKSIERELAKYSNLDVQIYQPSEGPPSGAPVLVTFFGDDLDELKVIANTAATILREIEGTRIVTSSGEDDASQFSLYIDREKTASLGISPAQVAGTLRTAVFGTEATTIKKEGEDIAVKVKLNFNDSPLSVEGANKATLDTVFELPIQTPQGTILLGTVLTGSLEASNDTIHREGGKRIVTASSQVEEGALGREVAMMFSARFSETVELPEGVTMKIGGETEDVDQSFKDMFRALAMGVVFVFGVLVIQFNRFRQAFIVLSVVPLSLIGVLLGLLLTREFLSFPSMLGFIALAGIVVNNAIILVDVWNRMRKTEPHMPIREVVIEGAALRLRPILLTTTTTIVGIAPLLFVSSLWRPIAVSIMFGLFFAVVLTLLLVPVLYMKCCKKAHNGNIAPYRAHDGDEIDENGHAREMEHIGTVLKKHHVPNVLSKAVTVLIIAGALFVPQSMQAFEYTLDNVQVSYHEAPTAFSLTGNGEHVGFTASGMPFRQRNITNDFGIRLQRFEIGLAYWYVSDKGVMWAENDLYALSIYLSRLS